MARISRIVGGFILIIAGIAMLALPGPGIITIIAGLALLAQDLSWAGRLQEWVKVKFARYTGEPVVEPESE
jgi:UPF0716 family protein affecting phage T7 exclusion